MALSFDDLALWHDPGNAHSSIVKSDHGIGSTQIAKGAVQRDVHHCVDLLEVASKCFDHSQASAPGHSIPS
jgi:hypothetical protein